MGHSGKLYLPTFFIPQSPFRKLQFLEEMAWQNSAYNTYAKVVGE